MSITTLAVRPSFRLLPFASLFVLNVGALLPAASFLCLRARDHSLPAMLLPSTALSGRRVEVLPLEGMLHL